MKRSTLFYLTRTARIALAAALGVGLGCTAAVPSPPDALCSSPPCIDAVDTERRRDDSTDAASGEIADNADDAELLDDADACSPAPEIRIVEVLYDPDGADDPAQEFVELAGAPDATIHGVSLTSIDGRSGSVVASVALDGITFDASGLALAPTMPEPLQNGPDGVALHGCDGSTLDALVWGDVDPGVFSATAAPDVPGGRSVALCAEDGSWAAATPSPGAANEPALFAGDACAPAPATDADLDAGAVSDVEVPPDVAPDAARDAASAADTATSEGDVGAAPDAVLDAGAPDADRDIDGGGTSTDTAPACTAAGAALAEAYPRSGEGDRGFLEIVGAPGERLDGVMVLVVDADGTELVAALDGLEIGDSGRLVVGDDDDAQLTADAAWIGLIACDAPLGASLSWGSDGEPPPSGWSSAWCDGSEAWGLARPTPGGPTVGWLDAWSCPGGCVATRRGVLRIDELLTDPEGTDGGREFVELLGPPLASIEGYELVGVNGSNGEPFLGPAPLRGRLDGAGRLVLGGDEVTERDGPLDGSLQNGPDSLVLLGCDGEVADAVAWGSFGSSEVPAGEGEPAARPAAGASLARPDGSLDTDDNARDFVASEPSPGRPNPIVVP